MGEEQTIIRPATRSELISPDQFSLGCYLFTLKLANAVNLPPYKGDIFHRALGKGLEQISPRFGCHFFQPEAPPDWPHPGQTPPKPFMLAPPAGGKTAFQTGDTLELGITLFGQAGQHLMTLFAALEKLGQTSGLDNGKGRFDIQRLIQITPDQPLELFANDQWRSESQPTTAADIFSKTPPAASQITLQMLTRLRLKDHGVLVRNKLPLTVLTDRLIGRINTLAAMYCGGLMLPPEEKTALTTLARTATISRDNTRWSDWSRDSGNSGNIKFGGLMGDITYQNVPAVLLPWLALGQWIGVGGKTSFGLGSYSMEIT